MALWTPDELTPTAWWDASNAGSLTVSSGYVDEWRDISGNDHHATQSGTSRPALTEDAINNLDAVSFSSPQYLNITNSISYTQHVLCCHVFTRASSGISSNLLSNMSSYYYSFWWAAATNYMWTRIGAAALQLGTAANTDSGTFLLVTKRTTTPQEMGWLDGTYMGARGGSGTLGSFDAMGRTYNNSSYQHNGYIAEIVFFVSGSEIPTEDREKIEGYLAWKWGINSKLPSGHTYYSAAPTTPDEFIPRVITPTYDSSHLLAAQLGL